MLAPRLSILLPALATAAMAQQPVPIPTPTVEPGQPDTSAKIEYPRDAARVIAEVNGRDVPFSELVQHMVERHDPHFAAFLATPGGARTLKQTPHPAAWVRQYADILALQAEARRRGLEPSNAAANLSAKLKGGFEKWLKEQSLPREPSQSLMNRHLAHYQRHHGLATEVQGWLDFLVSEQATDRQIRVYFGGHPRVFGGSVHCAHILVRHRDPATLELLGADERQRAWNKIADLKARLKEDGSNFEDLAAEFSEDRKTAARGGRFEHVRRFDPRLPAALCRTAWRIKDGEITGPVQSPYGLHLVKRYEITQRVFFLLSPETHPEVRRVRRRNRQEDLLFEVRETMGVQLRY